MHVESPIAAPTRKMLWSGRILSALPVLLLLFSATMKFLQPPDVLKGFVHLGYSERLAFPLGILELACTGIYLLPRTSVLGAILLTGYLGGAIATHVRVGEAFYIPLVLGVFVWGGIFLRDSRIRELIPLRRSTLRDGDV